MSTNKRIVIIEPYAMIAQGLRLMIDEIKGYEVSAIIADGHYIERIVPLHPDIIIINPSLIDIKKKGEAAKVAIRNIRRDANDALKKMNKANEISEDELKTNEDKVQKLTDKYIDKIDNAIDEKSKEILTV